jgi:hypothetical protein
MSAAIALLGTIVEERASKSCDASLLITGP